MRQQLKQIQKYRGRSTSSKLIRVMGDNHIGNRYAICSPEWWDVFREEKKMYEQLYQGWGELHDTMCDRNGRKAFVEIFNGDIIDGPNPKSLGDEQWSTDLNNQIRDARKLIRDSHRYEHGIMTIGSGYHVKQAGTHFEDMLAEQLECVNRFPRYGNGKGEIPVEITKGREREPGSGRAGQFADYTWCFEVNGWPFSVTHHIGFSKWAAYRTTALAREMVALELDANKTMVDGRKPAFVIRSHAHFYVQVRYGHTYGFVVPAWKFPDEHLYRGGEGGSAPSVGFADIIIEQNEERDIKDYLLTGLKYPKRYMHNFTPEYKGPKH